MTAISMTPTERRAASALATIFILRMIGLFMVLPVFAPYARELEGVTPFLAGLAIGAYGLTAALLQIPFGMFSDRWGRKPMLILGLLIFAAGSAIAAMGDHIWMVILGRAVQGAGAISAVVMALAADLTREEHRTKAMATIGASIGVAFLAAMVAGPVLTGLIGVNGLFWLTAGLTLTGIAVVKWWVPDPQESRMHRDTQAEPAQLSRVLGNSELLRLDLGIFTLHLVQTATFVVIPGLLIGNGLALEQHWQIYLPVMTLALGVMVPFIIIGEKRRRLKQILLGAVLVLAAAQLGLADLPASNLTIGFLLFAFFTGFNILEASLPSWISKVAPGQAKGTAMGVYSTSQFVGAFIGGALGGALHGTLGDTSVFFVSAGMLFIWFLVATGMPHPRYLTTHLVRVGSVEPAAARQMEQALVAVRGVAEAAVNPEDGVAYLKVDLHALDHAALEPFSQKA